MTTDVRDNTAVDAVAGKNGKRGFTLTEIAIVLGIIGLILGAIWVAAAAVYSNLRTSKATTELLTIVQNVRAMYATSGTVDPAADMTYGVQTGTALTYIQSKVFPSDMLNATNSAALDPWNGYAAVVSATTTITSDSFSVAFQSVPQSACISMITGNTGTGRDPGLTGVVVTVGNTAPTAATVPAAPLNSLPILASAAQAACTNTTTGQSVAFFFKMK